MSRSVMAACAASLLFVCTALAGAASAAPTSGVKGDPQPELKPFQIDKTPAQQGPGSVAIEPNGDIVVTYDIVDGSYHSGALIGSDDLGTDYTTYVAYAPKGDDFNACGPRSPRRPRARADRSASPSRARRPARSTIARWSPTCPASWSSATHRRRP